MKVTPPEVPTPGMAGGEKRERDPLRELAELLSRCALRMAAYCSSGFLRSSHGFQVTKKNAL